MPKNDGHCGDEPRPKTIDEQIDNFDSIQIMFRSIGDATR